MLANLLFDLRPPLFNLSKQIKKTPKTIDWLQSYFEFSNVIKTNKKRPGCCRLEVNKTLQQIYLITKLKKESFKKAEKTENVSKAIQILASSSKALMMNVSC